MSDQTECTPYIERQPGDPITAEDWNEMQCKIKEQFDGVDADKVDGFDASATPEPNTLLALDEDGRLPTSIIGDADNAAKLGGKPADAYVLKSELPDAGRITYRRYFKRLDPEDVLVIQHDMAAFPLVDVYELEPLPSDLPGKLVPGDDGNVFFYLYYGTSEADRSRLRTSDRTRKRWRWGTWAPHRPDDYSFDWLLEEAGVEYNVDDSLGDVVEEFWDVFLSGDPNDPFGYGISEWVYEHRGMDISELREPPGNEWYDIRLVVLPRKIFFGWFGLLLIGGGSEELFQDHLTMVSVRHLSYDTLELCNLSLQVTNTEGREVREPIRIDRLAERLAAAREEGGIVPGPANLMILLKV
jgi:hypothetical protein